MIRGKKVAAFALAALISCSSMRMPVFADELDAPTTEQTEPVVPNVSFTNVDEIVYPVGNVNVRTGPGLDYEVITTLRYGQAILRTGIGDNGWSRVSYQGKDAYMYTQLLTTKNPATGTRPGSADAERLNRQIAVANGLVEQEYTSESWAVLSEALEQARKIGANASQEEVDRAADALEKAIAALRTMDYTELEQAIAEAEKLVADNADYLLVARFSELLELAEELRAGGDQAAIDQCVGELNALMGEMEKWMERSQGPEIVIQEVEVEVPPATDFCNISTHQIWLIAFLASLVVNVALGVVILLLIRKKRYKAEDVPLVDYDIDDDM